MGRKYGSSKKDTGILFKGEKRTRGQGYLVNALVVLWPLLLSKCPICTCIWDLSASWARDEFFLLQYLGRYPGNADASVGGVYHCLPWRLNAQAFVTPFSLIFLFWLHTIGVASVNSFACWICVFSEYRYLLKLDWYLLTLDGLISQDSVQSS